MGPPYCFYQLVLFGLLWLLVMLYDAWSSKCVATQQRSFPPITPRHKRSSASKPFVGLTHKPHCAACAQEATYPQPLPPMPPDLIPLLNHRRRIAASWVEATYAPMAIPVAAHGGSSSVPPARATFWSIMAPSFMANGYQSN
jgi:hypothetical protein